MKCQFFFGVRVSGASQRESGSCSILAGYGVGSRAYWGVSKAFKDFQSVLESLGTLRERFRELPGTLQSGSVGVQKGYWDPFFIFEVSGDSWGFMGIFRFQLGSSR